PDPLAPPHLHSFPPRRSSDLPDAEDPRLEPHLVVALRLALAARLHRDPPLDGHLVGQPVRHHAPLPHARLRVEGAVLLVSEAVTDRKSTRLNSSHVKISYAVF